MKNSFRRPYLPQRARRTQRNFIDSLLGGFYTYRNSILGYVMILILGISLLPAYFARAETPTRMEPVKVAVHLMDASNQPLVDVMVNLVLNRYGNTIEEIQAGSCVTDATGSCSITVDRKSVV